MNTILVFLLLSNLFVFIWYYYSIKKDMQAHQNLVNILQEKIDNQTSQFTQNNSDKVDIGYQSIHFKLAILKNQVTLLTEISNLKE